MAAFFASAWSTTTPPKKSIACSQLYASSPLRVEEKFNTNNQLKKIEEG
jgi:hypothetical protein